MNSADRAIPSWMLPLRTLVRNLRILRHKIRLGNKLSLGEDVAFGKALELRPPQFMNVSDRVKIGPWFLTEVNLKIGPDVLISSKVSCIGNDHAFDDPSKTIFSNGRLPPCTVVMEGDNLIGYGAVIVGSLTIGKGCIVGAGAVVTRDLPGNTICAGVPAKVVRGRFD